MRAALLVPAAALFLLIVSKPVAGQAPPPAGAKAATTSAPGAKVPTPGQFPAYKPPRTADGKPDFNGIWQAFVTADIDIQDHDAQAGPHPDTMGAYDQWPGGQGIVEGGEIPYKPEALAQKKANAEKRMVVNITSDDHRHDTGDPELKCYMPGVPRANYMPFPFQIVQGPDRILMAYEYAREPAHDLHAGERQVHSPESSGRYLDGMVPRTLRRRTR